jgi:hypothetical protein
MDGQGGRGDGRDNDGHIYYVPTTPRRNRSANRSLQNVWNGFGDGNVTPIEASVRMHKRVKFAESFLAVGTVTETECEEEHICLSRTRDVVNNGNMLQRIDDRLTTIHTAVTALQAAVNTLPAIQAAVDTLPDLRLVVNKIQENVTALPAIRLEVGEDSIRELIEILHRAYPPGENPPGGNPPGENPPRQNPPGGENPPGGDNPPGGNPPGGNPPGGKP